MQKPAIFRLAVILSAVFLSPVFAEHNGKTQILLLGDSTTEGSIPRILQPEGPHLEQVLEQLLDLDKKLPPCQVINSGVSGEYIRRLIDQGRYARDVENLPGLDWIFVRYGINDRARLEDFDQNFPADFHELIGMLREDHPSAKIVLMTVIPFSSPEASEQINAHVRAVAEKEKLPVFDIYPRYAAELEKGKNMLNYRRYPVEKVPEELREFVDPYVVSGRVVVMANEFDGILGHLPGWYSDRHPNLAGYNVIADETAKWLSPHLRKEAEIRNLEFRAAIGAHHICSGLWVVGRESQRTAEEVVAQDLAPFPFFGWQSDFTYQVDEKRKMVTVTAPGAPPRSAKYTGDQGSTILPLGEEDVFFKPVPVPRALPDASKQAWPMGDIGASEPVPDGVDLEAVKAALDWAMEQEEQNTRAFVISYDGKIIGERYAPGWTQDTPQISWSQGKSITATLIGTLIQRGLIKLDQPAPLKEWQGEDDPRRQIRIRDLLQMSSGLDFTNLGFKAETLTARNEHMRVYFDSLNVLEHAVNQPLKVPPGTRNSYLNSDPLSLGKIIRDTVEAQGEDYLTFPQRALFDRIGARSCVLETDPWGNFILSGYDYVSARDWVRFGLLYLQDGVWQGERILPEGWTQFVATPAPADEKENYGGMFWLNRSLKMDQVPTDAYWAAGFMGQVTMIIPSRKLVVVRMGPSPAGVYPYLNETIGRVLNAIP